MQLLPCTRTWHQHVGGYARNSVYFPATEDGMVDNWLLGVGDYYNGSFTYVPQ